MSIFLTEKSKVIVQGMTGSEGGKHTRRMLASGTQVHGGVTPGKGGQSVDFDGTSVPVFGSVAEAIKETGADVTVVFVPPRFAKAAESMSRQQRHRADRLGGAPAARFRAAGPGRLPVLAARLRRRSGWARRPQPG